MGVTFEDWVKTNVGATAKFYGVGGSYPAYYVSYDDALAFIAALNARTGKAYRLPREAEWEYAARGGSAEPFCAGGCEFSGSASYWRTAWTSYNAGGRAHEVGERKYRIVEETQLVIFSDVLNGNELGIHDMGGNVSEWCKDNYVETLPGGTDPEVTTASVKHVRRGGDFYYQWGFSGNAHRGEFDNHDRRVQVIGFRVVLP
jgi:formylglycine-generating enzyme required for sulfatase activity